MIVSPIQIGSKGTNVSELQKCLSVIGYDLISDGDFGKKTDTAVKDFQTKNKLTPNGIVDVALFNLIKTKTGLPVYTTIKDTPSDISTQTDLNIITTARLHESQYLKQKYTKTQLFIHFTAGAPKAANVINGWDVDSPRIAVAYVVDGETGDVYEDFNPDFYAFHLGLENTNGRLDKISVGIEICAWGQLVLKSGKYYNYLNREVSLDKVYKLDKQFRGYDYFYAYSDAQLQNLEKLLRKLIKKYNIPVQKTFDDTWFDFKQDVIDNSTPGIWTHVTVRKDKTDSYPDKRLLDLLNRLAKESNP